jgi:hypothetical protein
MFKIITQSFFQLRKKPLLVFYLFGLNFLMALVIARPFYVTILNEANGSVALDDLLASFNFMIFTDFLHQSQKAFRPFLPMIFAMGMAYVGLYTFFSGGILATFKEEKFDFGLFFEASIRHFLRFALLLFYLIVFLLALLAFSGMFFFIFAAIAEGGTEKDYFFAMLPPLVLLGFFVAFVMVVGLYARVMLFSSASLSVYAAFWKSFAYVFKRPVTIAIFAIISGFGVVLWFLYLVVDSQVNTPSSWAIMGMFLVQQLMIFARVFFKTSMLLTAQNFFESKPISLEKADGTSTIPNAED